MHEQLLANFVATVLLSPKNMYDEYEKHAHKYNYQEVSGQFGLMIICYFYISSGDLCSGTGTYKNQIMVTFGDIT